jgi:hypothetical protein
MSSIARFVASGSARFDRSRLGARRRWRWGLLRLDLLVVFAGVPFVRTDERHH